MENTDNTPQNTKAHPKPTEDVQMNIETVTPDTEKEELPNDQKHNHTPSPSKEQVKKMDSSENDEGNDDPEDKRDEIETTSP